MRRRALLVSLLVAAAAGATFAFASTLNGVTAAKLTVYSAASTVPTSNCANSTLTDDTYVTAQGGNKNYGSQAGMNVTPGTTKAEWSFVRLTPCAPGNAHILSSTLQAYLRTSPGAGRGYGAYLVTGASWAEGTLTWNNKPAVSGSASSTATTGGNGTTMQWTVTSDVQGFVNGGANYGWAIEDGGAGNGTPTGTLDTKETGGGIPATLSMTYYP